MTFSEQTPVQIEVATSPEHLQDIRVLMREFSIWALETFHADDDLPPVVFENLETELANLPGRFAPPSGVLFVVLQRGQVIGCLGGAPHGPAKIEAARLWVRPDARGANAGRKLVKALVEHAQRTGVETIVLRSHKDMSAAHLIYKENGFVVLEGDRISDHFDDLEDIEIAMERHL